MPSLNDSQLTESGTITALPLPFKSFIQWIIGVVASGFSIHSAGPAAEIMTSKSNEQDSISPTCSTMAGSPSNWETKGELGKSASKNEIATPSNARSTMKMRQMGRPKTANASETNPITMPDKAIARPDASPQSNCLIPTRPQMMTGIAVNGLRIVNDKDACNQRSHCYPLRQCG